MRPVNDFKAIEHLLTWHEVSDNYDQVMKDMPEVGLVVKESDGTILLVGDLTNPFSSPGCGCCSDGIYPTHWADLAQLIPQLRQP